MTQGLDTKTPAEQRLADMVEAAERSLKAGDQQRGMAIAEQALSEGLEHPSLLRASAFLRWSTGRFEEGGNLLNRALIVSPRDPETIFEIGRLYAAQDRKREAIAAFEDAVTIAPKFSDAWFEKAVLHDSLAELNKAWTSYRKVLELSPKDAVALGALASIAARFGSLDEAVRLAERTLRLAPSNPGAICALAMVALERKEYDAARKRLELLLTSAFLKDNQRLQALGLLADAMNGLGRYNEAWRYYLETNALSRRLHAPRFGPGGEVEDNLEAMRRATAWLAGQEPDAWRRAAPKPESPSRVRQHFFLLGYARSGTTLAENIAASLPGVRALEEAPTLAQAQMAFHASTSSLDRLNALPDNELAYFRDAYWRCVAEAIKIDPGDVFVDMAPFHGINLPIIARLFSDAKIILCRRDPRDVVLSCFRRNFEIDAVTYQLTELESIARHYDATMHYLELCVDRLGLSVHVIRYEDLIADFETTSKSLAGFLGIEWTPDVHRFDITARERGVKTSSAPQVRSGLFDGTQAWRNYAAELQPVLPILSPWLKKFDYAE